MALTAVRNALSFGYEQVATRVGNLRVAGWETYKIITVVVRAPIDAAFDLATFGSDIIHSSTSMYTATELSYRIAKTYEKWLEVFNPLAKIKYAPDDTQSLEQDVVVNLRRPAQMQAEQMTLKRTIDVEKHPIAGGRIKISDTPTSLRTFAIQQQGWINYFNHKDSHWCNRHITTRLIAPVSALAAVVAGAVVTAMGVIAALLSFVTCGWSKRCNSFAWDNIRAPAWMLNQVHQGLLGIVRPDLV